MTAVGHLRVRAHRTEPLPAPVRPGGHPDRSGRRSRRARRRGIPAAVRHAARPLPRRGLGEGRLPLRRRPPHPAALRKETAARPELGRARRRHRPRGHLARPDAVGGGGAPRRRRAPRDPARASARAAGRDDRPRRQRRRALPRAPHDLERLVDGARSRAGRPKLLHEAFGIRRAIFTTVHSYTSAHRLADVPAEDKRRGRAAAENIIPQESRSTAMLAGLLPELAGRVSGYAMNVPVSNGSVVDLVCWHERPAARDAINEVVRTRRDRPGGPASSATRTSPSSPRTWPARATPRRSTVSRR